jgi:adenine deaminase
MIRELIRLGCEPLAAYRAASLSAAQAFGLKDRGMIAPASAPTSCCSTISKPARFRT